MKEDCIFCKLANGIIPTHSVYEDEDFNVILDADPATKGHSLIIPKKHFEDALCADDDVLKKALPLAKKIGNIQKKVFAADGVNILQNNGTCAGQTVFHLHIHVIPRYKDGDSILTWSHESFTEEEFSSIKSMMRETASV